jgi:hypothetical protein
MGSRRIRVTKPAFSEYSETVQVQGASELPISVKLVKETHEGRIAVSAGGDNMLYLDGKMMGQGHWEGTVPSGTHTLRVTAQGMKPYQTEIVLNDKENRTLGVTLEPEAKQGGGTAIWWVIGGVLVAGAAGSTVYLVTRNNRGACSSCSRRGFRDAIAALRRSHRRSSYLPRWLRRSSKDHHQR